MIGDTTKNIVNTKSDYDIDQRAVPNADIGGGEQPYVVPRQQGTGLTRGTQTITGAIQVNSFQTNSSIITISGTDGTQIFSDPKTKIKQIIIGTLPDGSHGMVISKPGVDVTTVFT